VNQHHPTSWCDTKVFKCVPGFCNWWWCGQFEILSKFRVLLKHFFLWMEEERYRIGLKSKARKHIWFSKLS
jgi:hypothetical protein